MTDIFSANTHIPPGTHVKVTPGWPSLQEIVGSPATAPSRVRFGNIDVPALFQMDISQSEPEHRLVSLLFRVAPESNELALPIVIALNNDVDAGLRWVRELKPIADWKAVALVQLTWSAFSSSALEPAGKNIEDVTPDSELLAIFEGMVSSLSGVSTRRRRRNTVSEDLLQEVAEVYRAAISGGAPTEAVKQHFHVSHSTATRYVRLARAANHLGPPGSKGGELPH